MLELITPSVRSPPPVLCAETEPLTEFSEQYHEQMLSAMSGAGVEI